MLEVEKLKEQFSKEFDMKDLGEARKILGMEIFRDRTNGFLYLSQRRYIKKVLKRFFIDIAKVDSTPFGSHFLFSKESCSRTKQEEEDMRGITYTNVVGSIMYAMVCSRSNIAQAMNMVSGVYSGNGII